jgi:hypothetical protein
MLKHMKQNRVSTLPTLIIVGLFSLAIGFAPLNSAGAPVLAVTASSASGRVTSPVVGINYDSELVGFPGNGSSNNPYMITNLAIAGNTADYCISIQDTRKHIVIYNCLFTNETDCEIFLRNATNIVVSNNTFCGGSIISSYPFSGTFVDNCTNVTISGNWFTKSTYTGGATAITIYANDTNIYVTGNQITDMFDGIYVGRGFDAATSNVFITGNLVSNCSAGIILFNLRNGYTCIARNTVNMCTKTISLTNSTNATLVDNIIINISNPGPIQNWYQVGFYILIGVAVVLVVVIVIQVARGRKS